MQITLYKNLSENNTVGKVLTSPLALGECTLRDAESILSPSLRIATTVSLAAYNYAYIPEFGRYYYIVDITAERTGVWAVSLRVDVLETYKDSIRGLSAIIERQENTYNLYLNDPEWKIYANKQILTREFPAGFTAGGGSYYLLMAGGYTAATSTQSLLMESERSDI